MINGTHSLNFIIVVRYKHDQKKRTEAHIHFSEDHRRFKPCMYWTILIILQLYMVCSSHGDCWLYFVNPRLWFLHVARDWNWKRNTNTGHVLTYCFKVLAGYPDNRASSLHILAYIYIYIFFFFFFFFGGGGGGALHHWHSWNRMIASERVMWNILCAMCWTFVMVMLYVISHLIGSRYIGKWLPKYVLCSQLAAKQNQQKLITQYVILYIPMLLNRVCWPYTSSTLFNLSVIQWITSH